MEKKSLYQEGYQIGYDLRGFGDGVIETAIHEMKFPEEFVKGMRQGRKDGKRDLKIEQREAMEKDNREYWRHIQAERQKQIDYDKLSPQERIPKTNKKKMEDLKFKKQQEYKDVITDPTFVKLKQDVEYELKQKAIEKPVGYEERVTENMDRNVEQAVKQKTFQAKDESVFEKRMKELGNITNTNTHHEKENEQSEEMSIKSPYQHEPTLDKESSEPNMRIKELEELANQHTNQEISKGK